MSENKLKERKIKLEQYFKKHFKKFPPREMDKIGVAVSHEAPLDRKK